MSWTYLSSPLFLFSITATLSSLSYYALCPGPVWLPERIVLKKWGLGAKYGGRNWIGNIFCAEGPFPAGVIGWNGELKEPMVVHVCGLEMCRVNWLGDFLYVPSLWWCLLNCPELVFSFSSLSTDTQFAIICKNYQLFCLILFSPLVFCGSHLCLYSFVY